MIYSTIVEKNEEGLNMIIKAAEDFEQGKYLEAINNLHYKKEEIMQITEFVKQYRALLSREHLALAKFALTFNREYATTNNTCFSTAEKLFGKIRSTISASKKVYKKFCRKNRRPLPPSATERPSVFKRSELVESYHSGNMFGFETYDECVQKLYEQLEGFFKELVKSLALCHMIILEESNIRNTPERCMQIYRECYQAMLGNSRAIVRSLKKSTIIHMESEMENRRKKASSMTEFVCESFHKFNPGDFQIHVISFEFQKEDGQSEVEKILFGANNEEKVNRARFVIQHFDELEEDAHKGKHKNKHSAYCVASFMFWCGVGNTLDDKVKMFVEEYFNKTYSGDYPAVKTNAVNSAKNILLRLDRFKESPLDNNLFHAKIESLAAQFESNDDATLKNAGNN